VISAGAVLVGRAAGALTSLGLLAEFISLLVVTVSSLSVWFVAPSEVSVGIDI
jgi:hypothetical protein